jgi:cupin fold WbuC family metalloprotein
MSVSAPNVVFPRATIAAVGSDWLDSLKRLALAAGNKRARVCLHRDERSTVQQMLIVFHRSTFIGPHRQKRQFKSYTVLHGQLSVSFFDELGNMTDYQLLGEIATRNPFLLRFPASRWHMAVPITEWTVFIETVEGPFTPTSTEYAPWGPDYGNPVEVNAFLERIEMTKRSMSHD